MRNLNSVVYPVLFMVNIVIAQTSNVVEQFHVGDVGEDALNLSGLTTITVTGSSFIGGGGDTNPGTISGGDKSGGAGLITSGGEVSIGSSNLQGGKGGISSVNNVSLQTLDGGDGYLHSGASIAISLDGSFTGGMGGSATNDFGGLKTHGGDGVNLTDVSTSVNVNNGSYVGGNAGVARLNSTDNATVYAQTYLDINGAHGGHGLRITRFDQVPNGDELRITAGTFSGGDGGVVTNIQSGLTTAQGGSGVFSDYADVTVDGGVFSGGKAGTFNGVSDSRGAGFHAQDSNLTINEGVFNGLGLRYEARYYDVQNTINGGTFDKVEYISNYDDFLGTSNRVTRAVINEGTIQTLYLKGETINEVVINGGTIEKSIELLGSGSNMLSISGLANVGDVHVSGSSYNALSVGGSAALNRITQSSGYTDVNAWGDDHFMDTMVLGGVLNFNNQDFNLLDGASLVVTGSDAAVNFMGDRATVKSGASLIVSTGSVEANELQVESGGSVRQTITSDGADSFAVSEIMSDSLTVDAGALWQLYNDGSFTDFNSVLGTDGFLLGASSGAITNNMLVSDVQLTGVGVDAFWLYGISDLHVVTNGANQDLYARYGIQDLAEALAAEGDMATLLGVMQPLVEGNTTVRDLMIELGSAELATAKISAGFLRTAEMANSLSGAQSVLADQIGLRTREHLRSYQLAGKTGPVGARGPSSWWDQSMSWLGNRVPEFSVRDSIRSMQERVPSVNSSSRSWTESWPELDVRDTLRSVDEKSPSLDFSSEKPPVQKAWVSGSKDSPVPSDRLRSLSERSPDIKPGLALPARYQTWGRAYLADVDQESVDGFAGYDASVVGGVVGVDRRFDQAVLGLAGGLSETTVTGATGNDGEATSLQGTAYASYFTDLFYLNAHVSYAVSDVETTGVEEFGYAADYDANNLSFFVGAGFGLKGFDDSVLFTPEVSLLSTRYARDGYTSSSSLKDTLGIEDMEFDSYEQWSHQSEVGAAVSMVRVLDNARLQMAFQPELRVHWVHQFEPDMDAESYRFTGTAETLNARLQSREEDLIRLGAGVRFWNWDSQTTEFGLNLDHLTGGAYAEWMVSGHFIHRF